MTLPSKKGSRKENGLVLGNTIFDPDFFLIWLLIPTLQLHLSGLLNILCSSYFCTTLIRFDSNKKASMTQMKQNTLCINKTIVKSPSYSLFTYIYLHQKARNFLCLYFSVI